MDTYLEEALRIARSIQDDEKRACALDTVAHALAVVDPVATRALLKEIDYEILPTSYTSIMIALYALHRQRKDLLAAEAMILILRPLARELADEQEKVLKHVIEMTPEDFRKQLRHPSAEERAKSLEDSKKREQGLRASRGPLALIFGEICIQVIMGDDESLIRSMEVMPPIPEVVDCLESSLVFRYAFTRQLAKAQKHLANIRSPEKRVSCLCTISELARFLESMPE